MSSALFGLVSAAGLGTADFMARASARAVGAPLAYTGVLVVGALLMSAVMVISGAPFTWSQTGNLYAAAHGIAVAGMCVMLYAGLARGPVAIVAPIVAAHPALVLAVNVAAGARPSLIQWCAMAGVLAGGLLIARSAERHPQAAAQGEGGMKTTLLIAFGACLAYVVLILTGQAAAPLIGEMQTVLVGRWSGLAVMSAFLIASRATLTVPAPWRPYLLVQGVLDTLGYLALMAGSVLAAPHITMVVASTFSVFTVILARLLLKELISAEQWTAIALIASGTAALAGSG